jgi:hypothetical protein
VKHRLEDLIRRIPGAIEKALYQEGLIEETESRKRTPVEFNTLRSSHVTERTEWDGNTAYVRIVVGGPAAPYALYVHENLEAHHNVGQAKFLESTLNESAPFIAARVAKRIEMAKLVAA